MAVEESELTYAFLLRPCLSGGHSARQTARGWRRKEGGGEVGGWGILRVISLSGEGPIRLQRVHTGTERIKQGGGPHRGAWVVGVSQS